MSCRNILLDHCEVSRIEVTKLLQLVTKKLNAITRRYNTQSVCEMNTEAITTPSNNKRWFLWVV